MSAAQVGSRHGLSPQREARKRLSTLPPIGHLSPGKPRCGSGACTQQFKSKRGCFRVSLVPRVRVWALSISSLVGLVGVAVLVASASAVPADKTHAPSKPGLIAYHRLGNGVYVMRSDGSGVRPLRRGGAAVGASELAWSPKGLRLLFFSRTGANGKAAKDAGIWVMNADGTHLKRVATLRPPDPWGFSARPTWSPNGRQIVFFDSPNIWVVNADGTHKHLLAKGTKESSSADSGVFPRQPSWSPVGRRILFANGHCENKQTYAEPWYMCYDDLVVADPGGSKRRVLRHGESNVPKHWGFVSDGWWGESYFAPTWSADGRMIAVISTVHDDNGVPPSRDDTELLLIDAEGGPMHYTRTHLVPPLAWSPDGSSIVAVKEGNSGSSRTLLTFATDRSTIRTFLSLPRRTAIRHLQWSPGGGHLVFSTSEPWIYVVGPGGTDLRRLVKGTWPSWRPVSRD